MAKQDGTSAENVEALIATLHGYLHAETYMGEPLPMQFSKESGVHPPDQAGIEVTVQVRNDAPSSGYGGEVVFMGVGLSISDGREEGRELLGWAQDIKKTRLSDQMTLRLKYRQRVWISGRQPFPATTPDEESFGDILFPGEGVVYKMKIPITYLPYTEIRVEGTVSRRHFFHLVKSVKDLEQWTKPLLVKAFHALNAVDIHRPIQTATNAIPNFSPTTTLNEVSAFRQAVSEATDQIEDMSPTLNKVFHSAPNQEVREHLDDVVYPYLKAVREACEHTLKVLPSGDTEQMRDGADTLKQQLAASHEVDHKTLQLISRFGITPEEAHFSRRTS